MYRLLWFDKLTNQLRVTELWVDGMAMGGNCDCGRDWRGGAAVAEQWSG